MEFNSLNPHVIDEIILNDIRYNGKDKSSLILHGVGGKPILAKTENQKLLVDMLNKNNLFLLSDLLVQERLILE